jgi:hypothetical protein
MLCQGDAMTKDISLELAVIPRFLLMVAVIDVAGGVVVVGIILGNRKCEFRNIDKWNVIRARIKDSP